jgi:hypothetical protein
MMGRIATACVEPLPPAARMYPGQSMLQTNSTQYRCTNFRGVECPRGWAPRQ